MSLDVRFPAILALYIRIPRCLYIGKLPFRSNKGVCLHRLQDIVFHRFGYDRAGGYGQNFPPIYRHFRNGMVDQFQILSLFLPLLFLYLEQIQVKIISS